MGGDMFKGVITAALVLGGIIGAAVVGLTWVLWHYVISRLAWT